jgi:hypothetical protein
MRFVQHSYERPLTRDVLAAALKTPFKLHGIKASPSIMLVSEEGAADLRKLMREPPEDPNRFIAGGFLTIVVPNSCLYRVLVFGLPNSDMDSE